MPGLSMHRMSPALSTMGCWRVTAGELTFWLYNQFALDARVLNKGARIGFRPQQRGVTDAWRIRGEDSVSRQVIGDSDLPDLRFSTRREAFRVLEAYLAAEGQL